MIRMLAIVGQTAGPKWLNIVRRPMGTPWVTQAKNILKCVLIPRASLKT